MKILIPTDFSPLSKVAAVYAAKLAIELDASLILVHALFIEQPIRPLADSTADEILTKLKEEGGNECQMLIDEIKQEVSSELKIEYKVESGKSVKDTITSLARENGVELIVMGTKGARGLKKVFLGSNASDVINSTPVPVIAVPEHAEFSGLTNLVYASDLKDSLTELRTLLPLAKKFDSYIHLLHIYQPGSVPRQNDLSLAELLRKQLDHPKIDCHFVCSDEVDTGIERYLERKPADIIAFFPTERTFFERLLGKSETMEMVFKGRLPLLTLCK